MKIEFFENDTERWQALSRLRYDVARYLKIKSRSKILDVLVGYADFSRAIAKVHDIKVTAIEIADEDIKKANERIKKEGLQDKVRIIKMDATDMEFPDGYFDWVINFIGWEDLTAISGKRGVERVFSEMTRVLKKTGTLVITFIPEIGVTDAISKKDKELEDYIWLGKKRRMFFDERFFTGLFKKYNIKVIDRKPFRTTKHRIKAEDAKGVLKWFEDNYESFYPPDVKMRPYKEIMKKFGLFIDKYGMEEDACRVIVLIGKKT